MTSEGCDDAKMYGRGGGVVLVVLLKIPICLRIFNFIVLKVYLLYNVRRLHLIPHSKPTSFYNELNFNALSLHIHRYFWFPRFV